MSQAQSLNISSGLASGPGWVRRDGLPRKTAESTGMFPPTPTPMTASKDASVTKFDEPPEARPKIPAINNVMLKDHLQAEFRYHSYTFRCPGDDTNRLPQMSHPRPQSMAPTRSPMFIASERNGPLNRNSAITGLKMRPPRS